MPPDIEEWLCESTAIETSVSSPVTRPTELMIQRLPSVERGSQPFFTVNFSPERATAGTPQSWAASTLLIRVYASLREPASSGLFAETSWDSSFTWSFTVVRVRPQALFTFVLVSPSRLSQD